MAPEGSESAGREALPCSTERRRLRRGWVQLIALTTTHLQFEHQGSVLRSYHVEFTNPQDRVPLPK